MRRTILASLLAGLLAGCVGALIVVLVIDDDDVPVSVAPTATTRTETAQSQTDQTEAQTSSPTEARVQPRDGASGGPGRTPDGDAGAGPEVLDIPSLVERVTASVVLITVQLPDGVDEDGRTVARGGIGTGVILNDQGHILTNQHVVQGASRIELQLHDGSTRLAELVGGDAPFTDLAVLRTDPAGLTPATFAASADLRIGDRILALGNALGNDAAVTLGIVSNPSARFFDSEAGRQDYIQTDAALNPGNSGGPILRSDGAVVGLATRVVTSTGDGQTVQGVGFALPTDRILPIAERIIAGGASFPRPDFGVVDQRNLDEFVARQVGVERTSGALLLEISRVGALAQAGIRPGDIIISLNGFAVTEDTPYLNVLQELEPGRPVDVVYLDQQAEERVIEVIPVLRRR